MPQLIPLKFSSKIAFQTPRKKTDCDDAKSLSKYPVDKYNRGRIIFKTAKAHQQFIGS